MSNAGFLENRHQKIWKKANRKLKTSSTILLEDKEGISEKKVEQDDNALKEGIIEKKVEQDVNEYKSIQYHFNLKNITIDIKRRSLKRTSMKRVTPKFVQMTKKKSKKLRMDKYELCEIENLILV